MHIGPHTDLCQLFSMDFNMAIKLVQRAGTHQATSHYDRNDDFDILEFFSVAYFIGKI